MVLGIGVDIVEVDRFKLWVNYSSEHLLRVFSVSELEYIFAGSQDFAIQKMATRYAAKEAFYKAFSAMLLKLKKTQKTISFLSTCRVVSIALDHWEVPAFVIDWNFFEDKLMNTMPDVEVNLSMSHEKKYAIAYVIIQEKKNKGLCGA